MIGKNSEIDSTKNLLPATCSGIITKQRDNLVAFHKRQGNSTRDLGNSRKLHQLLSCKGPDYVSHRNRHSSINVTRLMCACDAFDG